MILPVEMPVPPKAVQFLEANGWDGADILSVAGDASFRRYFRVVDRHGRCAILMDAPPPHEDPRPFIDIARYLTRNGFRAPAIFAADLTAGLVLLEDFGDARMREHLDDHPEDEKRIYCQAIDTIIRLSRAPSADLLPYDMAAYLREVRLFSEWYVPAMQLDFDEHEFDEIWRQSLAPIASQQFVTVLRDYHAENIMLLDDGEQGIIDFQDALIGHPAYDLVSLLQDARRDVSTALEASMLHYYQSNAKTGPDFGLHYALLGAQRNTKIIGIFTRLWKRDGKERYLHFLPRMWEYLERDLAHPGLAPLKQWFSRNIPSHVRVVSPLDVAR
jgi:N-acetylmuramate 1-kinase